MNEDASKKCSDPLDHCWYPLVRIDVASSAWAWACRRCNKIERSKPDGVPGFISLRDLEGLVDSSLKAADLVYADDQSLRGDLWLMRNANWVYFPYEFQLLYHIFGGDPFVVLFRYKDVREGLWGNVRDTAGYAGLLVIADHVRPKYDQGAIRLIRREHE